MDNISTPTIFIYGFSTSLLAVILTFIETATPIFQFVAIIILIINGLIGAFMQIDKYFRSKEQRKGNNT